MCLDIRLVFDETNCMANFYIFLKPASLYIVCICNAYCVVCRLDSAESAKDSAVKEAAKFHRMLELQNKLITGYDITFSQISSLKSELEQLHNTMIIPKAACLTSDPTPLDQKDVLDDQNDEHIGSDNGFKDIVPSSITPSPYLDFVPLEAKGTEVQKKDSVEAKGTEEQKKDSAVVCKKVTWVSDI